MQQKIIMAPDAGVFQNLPKNLINDTAWSDGSNVHFGPGYAEKAGGWLKFIATQLDGPVMAIDNYFKFNGDSYLMFITTKRVYYYDPIVGAVVDITGPTPLTGTPDHPVFTENAQNMFVFTNGVDPVKCWNGTGTIADLPGLTDCEGGVTSVRAKCLLFAENFLLLCNTVEDGVAYPQRIRWSKLGDITTWKNDASSHGEAGYGDLTDGIDWGQSLRPLGEYVIAYKERSIVVMRYVGSPTVWNVYPAIQGTGLLAPKALVDLGDEHIFIGPDNIYSFNGREVTVAGDAVAREFLKVLDPANTVRINTAYLEEIPEAWFSFPSTDGAGTPDRAIVYNPDTKAWSWRDAPMLCYGYYNRRDDPTFDTDEDVLDSIDSEWDSSVNLGNAPINLCGDEQGFLYVLEGNTQDGADYTGFVRTKLFDLDDPYHLKRVKRIQFLISREGPYNLQVKIGTAANVDEPITWSAPSLMSLDVTSPPWIDVDFTARYFMFEFATLAKDQPFRLTGYIVYYDVRGSK